ncbi:hypothetical protein UA08_09512 [Talaromyces atroroseus]|uniref:LysM domain-containing protein n=1 Tax=Talaromyces atroroseus TaxID=1441469 RepID=A0A1Q5Q5W3_TALAT|nr:hypothetical protein UA08_09512 [Talaromyces atroroseus]OKL55215.1 hypothetical protein UA08_09512 [Talaromyces atroroseus]
MNLFYRVVYALVSIKLVGAYLVTPPGTAAPGTTSACSEWVQMSYALTCEIIESYFGLTAAEFEEWNPSVTELGSGCTMIQDLYYCVQIDFVAMSTGFSTSLTGIYIPSSTSGTTTMITTTTMVTTATTTTGDGISTPSPIQTGMANNCDMFHLVVSGDTCDAIATAANVSLATFYAWNPAVGSSCTALDLGDYVCIGVIGSTTSSASIASVSSSSGDGISTPMPIQTGMVSTCDAFHLVVSGDTCAAIATAAGISLTNFYAWNPAVGTSCTSLDLGDYVCIGVIGSTSVTTSSSSSGDGISTPTPIQTGMVSNCDAFHLVVSGDTCAALATAAGISLTNFYAWNPAVGTSCTGLDLGDYVCIGITGSTSATQTTSTGNGVTTPTPTQAGMVTDCDEFHDVVSTDSCDSIAEAANISLSDFYAWNSGVGSSCGSLWLGYYVCTGIL